MAFGARAATRHLMLASEPEGRMSRRAAMKYALDAHGHDWPHTRRPIDFGSGRNTQGDPAWPKIALRGGWQPSSLQT
jgi:hypothetical protein